MNLLILRDYELDHTDGEIYGEDGKHICYSFELPWKENKQDISCIPEGSYKFNKFFSANFGHWIYKINKVPNRGLVRIHDGNTVRDILGCILVGLKQGTLDVEGKEYPAVLNSDKALEKLLGITGSEGIITIKNRNEKETPKTV